MFPVSAPFYVLQGSTHCPLRNEFAGERKSRFTPKVSQGCAPVSRECVAPLGWTSQVAASGNMLLLDTVVSLTGIVFTDQH